MTAGFLTVTSRRALDDDGEGDGETDVWIGI
jgi:hypothetical protein